jgi:hypothetical protein
MIKQLKSVAELNSIFESAKAKQAALDTQTQVKVHLGSCGIASGADKVLEAFNKELGGEENRRRKSRTTQEHRRGESCMYRALRRRADRNRIGSRPGKSNLL